MHQIILKLFSKLMKVALFALLAFAAVACQPEKENSEAIAATATEEAAVPATAAVAEKRPAPVFFFVPQELVDKRVWICDNEVSDIFHLQHDCPILVQCKGNGTFRNLKLPRAIEEFGRYNCQECSKELDVIFDEDAVRVLGQ
ncbi:hypothetical protein SAMN04487941_1396 [Pontibacter akesuensis]|uniref:Uncharacterized protein n=2 Tax=Pontibacter akesuensis TaxID=388950 RepID=A0A1I7H052_9BACT|nr:hypothetical protein SAMN04487941_1396 [Pontibacter akesuensis]